MAPRQARESRTAAGNRKSRLVTPGYDDSAGARVGGNATGSGEASFSRILRQDTEQLCARDSARYSFFHDNQSSPDAQSSF